MSVYFSLCFSFRAHLLECSAAHGVAGSARPLCVCGFGLVAWLKTSTPILLGQVLEQNIFIYAKFELLVQGSNISIQPGVHVDFEPCSNILHPENSTYPVT